MASPPQRAVTARDEPTVGTSLFGEERHHPQRPLTLRARPGRHLQAKLIDKDMTFVWCFGHPGGVQSSQKPFSCLALISCTPVVALGGGDQLLREEGVNAPLGQFCEGSPRVAAF